MPFATPNFIRDSKHIPEPCQTTFYSAKGAVAVAAEKANIEATFVGVGYVYEQQADSSYKVTLTGPVNAFKAAVAFLFPKKYPFTLEKTSGPGGINLGDLTS